MFAINKRITGVIFIVLILVLPVIFLATPGSAQVKINNILLEQLHLLNLTNTIHFSPIGMMTFNYTPDSCGHYLNVVALCKLQQPQWIIRNLYLPDSSWISSDQSISARFDFRQLGMDIGEAVPVLEMGIVTSKSIYEQMPLFTQFLPVNVDTLIDDSQGEETVLPDSLPVIEEYSLFPEFAVGDTVCQVQYRGCLVPNIDLDDSKYPDTDDYAGDQNACVPASAANSLKWLDSVYQEIDIPDSLRGVMQELSALMKRARNNGVKIEEFVLGKLDYIQKYKLPINVKFQSCIVTRDIASTDGLTFARNDNTGPYPTWEWLKQQVDEGEDVELCYFWWDGDRWRGHAVVVTGVEESVNGRKSIKFKHDTYQKGAGGIKQENENIFIDSSGRMILRTRIAFIGHVVAESPGDPYPVELVSFTARLQQKNVVLSWQTATESNNYGFIIYRNNARITFIEGNGTTVEPQVYSYTDIGLNEGSYKYELYQVDFDGTRAKVGALEISVTTRPTEVALFQNYPNPFNPTTWISYTIPARSYVSLRVYNLLGEEVTSLVNEMKEAGRYEVEFSASNLPGGIYFYRLETGSHVAQKKFILLK